MNVQQFSDLQKGNKIENGLNGSRGEVSRTTNEGVYVIWGDPPPPHGQEFFFSVAGTAWFHWNRIENEQGKTATADAPQAQG